MKNIRYIDLIRFYGEEILESDNFKKQKGFIQHGEITVYEHSLKVTITCLKIANRLNIPVDQKSLIRGALLHDYFLYDWHIPDKNHKWHGFIHANIALQNANKEYELTEIEKNMIYCHMFPLNLRIPKYIESVILCIADKIVATTETLEPYVKILATYQQYM